MTASSQPIPRTVTADTVLVVPTVELKMTPGCYEYGLLTVTPWDVTLDVQGFLPDQVIHVYRDQIAGLVESWRPLLFGRSTVRFWVDETRYVFRLRKFRDVVRMRDILTSRIIAEP